MATSWDAPIKPEYLLPRLPESSVPDSEPELPAGTKRFSKKARGQNKKRKNDSGVRAAQNQDLCNFLAAENSCSKDDKCNKSHDVDAFLKDVHANEFTLPSRIGLPPETCIFKSAGFICPAGLNCHMGPLAHCDPKTGANLRPDGTPVALGDIKAQQPQELNSAAQLSEASARLGRLRCRRPPKQRAESTPSSNPLLQGDETDFNDSNSTVDESAHEKSTPPNSDAIGAVVTKEKDSVVMKREKFRDMINGKLFLAPLTTVGNLPYRRLCIGQGADITVSEMALASSILQLKPADISLLRRHPSEKIFGLQVAGGFQDVMHGFAELVEEADLSYDFIDVNMGCPLDGLHQKLAGCMLMTREKNLKSIVESMTQTLTCPLSIKCRICYTETQGPKIFDLAPKMCEWGISGITLHGRTARQRYQKEADWEAVEKLASVVEEWKVPVIGNGDLMGPEQCADVLRGSRANALMIGRGALIKPWIFKEIKEGQLWDISASERFDLMKEFCRYGLEHWGCDGRGVETTRRFLLEQLSFWHRYIPVGLLEVAPQKLNWRVPPCLGRNELETLMMGQTSSSWIELSERLLGPVPEGFTFVPKHKSSAAD